MNYKMIISDIQAAILAFVGLLLALIIGAACGLLLLAFHNRIIKVFAGGEANGSLKLKLHRGTPLVLWICFLWLGNDRL